MEETRIAVISIVVKNRQMADRVNDILSKHGDVIRGRLGVPYPERGISVISVLVDAEQSVLGAISGSLGNVPGVTLRSTILM